MERLRRQSFGAVTHVVLIVGLAARVSACRPGEQREQGEQPTPGFGAPVESVPRDSVLRYAASLRFIGKDEDHGAGDEQPMLYRAGDPRAAVVGPGTTVARVEPEARTTRLTRAQLRQGRIIARILSTGVYEPLGLRRGVNYVWIDSTAAGWRAIIIPETTTEPLDTVRVTSESAPHITDAPGARWYYFSDVGTMAWIRNRECWEISDPDVRLPPPRPVLPRLLSPGQLTTGSPQRQP
jgi:hypothetical protein